MKYINYFFYLLRHKWYVMVECFKAGLYWQGVVHDLDKFKWEDFKPYAQMFGDDGYKTPFPQGLHIKSGNRAINSAWLRHRKRSPHHWQYYVYGLKFPAKMPTKYVQEMVCDWKGAIKAKGEGKKELMDWFLYNREFMILHIKTRAYVNKLMGLKHENSK